MSRAAHLMTWASYEPLAMRCSMSEGVGPLRNGSQVMSGTCPSFQIEVDLFEGHCPVDARFAGAEQVQVGSVKNQ